MNVYYGSNNILEDTFLNGVNQFQYDVNMSSVCHKNVQATATEASEQPLMLRQSPELGHLLRLKRCTLSELKERIARINQKLDQHRIRKSLNGQLPHHYKQNTLPSIGNAQSFGALDRYRPISRMQLTENQMQRPIISRIVNHQHENEPHLIPQFERKFPVRLNHFTKLGKQKYISPPLQFDKHDTIISSLQFRESDPISRLPPSPRLRNNLKTSMANSFNIKSRPKLFYEKMNQKIHSPDEISFEIRKSSASRRHTVTNQNDQKELKQPNESVIVSNDDVSPLLGKPVDYIVDGLNMSINNSLGRALNGSVERDGNEVSNDLKSTYSFNKPVLEFDSIDIDDERNNSSFINTSTTNLMNKLRVSDSENIEVEEIAAPVININSYNIPNIYRNISWGERESQTPTNDDIDYNVKSVENTILDNQTNNDIHNSTQFINNKNSTNYFVSSPRDKPSKLSSEKSLNSADFSNGPLSPFSWHNNTSIDNIYSENDNSVTDIFQNEYSIEHISDEEDLILVDTKSLDHYTAIDDNISVINKSDLPKHVFSYNRYNSDHNVEREEKHITSSEEYRPSYGDPLPVTVMHSNDYVPQVSKVFILKTLKSENANFAIPKAVHLYLDTPGNN